MLTASSSLFVFKPLQHPFVSNFFFLIESSGWWYIPNQTTMVANGRQEAEEPFTFSVWLWSWCGCGCCCKTDNDQPAAVVSDSARDLYIRLGLLTLLLIGIAAVALYQINPESMWDLIYISKSAVALFEEGHWTKKFVFMYMSPQFWILLAGNMMFSSALVLCNFWSGGKRTESTALADARGNGNRRNFNGAF